MSLCGETSVVVSTLICRGPKFSTMMGPSKDLLSSLNQSLKFCMTGLKYIWVTSFLHILFATWLFGGLNKQNMIHKQSSVGCAMQSDKTTKLL